MKWTLEHELQLKRLKTLIEVRMFQLFWVQDIIIM